MKQLRIHINGGDEDLASVASLLMRNPKLEIVHFQKLNAEGLGEMTGGGYGNGGYPEQPANHVRWNHPGGGDARTRGLNVNAASYRKYGNNPKARFMVAPETGHTVIDPKATAAALGIPFDKLLSGVWPRGSLESAAKSSYSQTGSKRPRGKNKDTSPAAGAAG